VIADTSQQAGGFLVIKVAMIGAGSVVFSKNLTGDILSYPEFRGATLSYMDVDRERLAVGAALCGKVGAALGACPRIEATTDRRAALAGADFVINMMQVGGFDATLVDFEIPRKYGLNFTIADTTGPGGMFRALRTFPILAGLCRDMEEVCPGALLLNYSNPMSMNMQTITRASGIGAVGLCHSVQGTLNDIMGYIGEKPQEVAFVCAGINHMAFYLRLEKGGRDLYPRLFAAMRESRIYGRDQVRFELMRRLGYFVTESSEHNAEYNPWFVPHGRAHSAKYNVPIDEYLRRCDRVVEEFERLREFSRSNATIEVRRSQEYGSTIIHSMVTGKPAVVYGNMPNRGAITNLAADAIAEAPTLVDRAGLRFAMVGDLPPQLLAYVQPHVAQHELFIRAALEGRRDHVYQAAMFDPLTAGVLTPDQIVDMCDELIAAHGFVSQGGVLPDLDAKKTLVSAGGKTFGPVSGRELREKWCASRRTGLEEYILSWQVIGPFPTAAGSACGLELATPVEEEFLRGQGGAIDRHAVYRAGTREFCWREASADEQGCVDLGTALGQIEWAVAYGYAEVHSNCEREVVLRLGSDDGIKVWVNGQLVHYHEVGRAYRADSDVAPARLNAGMNRIFVKIDNYTGGWGFGVAVGGIESEE
jgi:alpha-galactosidase